MSSAPCRAQKLKISARHQARFLYVAQSHVLPVSACVASGATTTNTSQQAENAGNDVMARRCSALFACGIETKSTQTRTAPTSTPEASATALMAQHMDS
jgi:hypothetical protein